MHSCQVDEKPFKCSQCEFRGIVDFDTFISHDRVKISVQNLPSNITAAGVQNLFVNVGKPLNIKYFPDINSATVEFDSLIKGELAIRNLNNKPPYNLKVFLLSSKSPLNFPNSFNKWPRHVLGNVTSDEKTEKFLLEEISVDDEAKHRKEVTEMSNELQSLFKNLNYDSSYRMHQKNFDFEIENANSISMGRGYFYLREDRFLGGLQRFTATSESDEDSFREIHFCKNCHSPTTKICTICLDSFCSNLCLNTNLVHKNGSCFSDSKRDCEEFRRSYSTIDQLEQSDEDHASLKSPCSVIISTFLTLKEVFVRRIDDSREEKFSRICNEVAAAAAEVAEKSPKRLLVAGELCIAKFYKDRCYYRGKVLSFDKEKVMVFFIDFGNVQETNLEDLKSLPENLKRISGLAVKINLIDVPEGTSGAAINYFNFLTAEMIPLILTFKNSVFDGVTLTEKESGDSVNKKVASLIMPSWKKDTSVLSKLGRTFYMDSIPSQSLEVGKVYNLTLAYVDKEEFDKFHSYWMIDSDSDNYNYVKGELRARILEYCEHLENDYYLPRENELCIGKHDGEWRRCVNLKSDGTTCWLFFIDEGKTSLVETKNIRKMIEDFLEGPSQAIRCELTSGMNSEHRRKMYEFMENNVGHVIESVFVKSFQNGAYTVAFSGI